MMSQLQDTQKIEKKLLLILNPLFITLFTEMSIATKYAYKGKIQESEIQRIIEQWIINNRGIITAAIDDSLKQCVDLALDYVVPEDAPLDKLNFVMNKKDDLQTLSDATKTQVSLIVDYLQSEFEQLLMFINVYRYPVPLTNEYITRTKSAMNDKLELTVVNSTLKNYGIIFATICIANGIGEYTYRTQKDNRVRESHAAHEGKKFSWISPPNTGHPGTEINCRCWREIV